jgi:hypothetical protein
MDTAEGACDLPESYILKADLRVTGGQFEQQLLLPRDESTGRLDARYYDTGHMIYVVPQALAELHDNIAQFIHASSGGAPAGH